MGRLDNKIAIVTGGAQGQGAAIARAYVAEGAKVVIADVAKDEGQALADELGANAHFAHHDVSDEASWTALVEDTNARFGPVNVLANNAGILRFGDIERMPAAEVELELDDCPAEAAVDFAVSVAVSVLEPQPVRASVAATATAASERFMLGVPSVFSVGATGSGRTG